MPRIYGVESSPAKEECTLYKTTPAILAAKDCRFMNFEFCVQKSQEESILRTVIFILIASYYTLP